MTNETMPAEVRSNDGLCMLDDDEADPVRLWAEIHRLRAAVQGPDGFATWQEAATAERVRRAARIEEAYREGFAARETYNDMDVNNVDEEWAKAKASLLRPNAQAHSPEGSSAAQG